MNDMVARYLDCWNETNPPPGWPLPWQRSAHTDPASPAPGQAPGSTWRPPSRD